MSQRHRLAERQKSFPSWQIPLKLTDWVEICNAHHAIPGSLHRQNMECSLLLCLPLVRVTIRGFCLLCGQGLVTYHKNSSVH